MTNIVVVVTKAPTTLPAGVTFAGTAVAVTDNSGAKLNPVVLNGTETPPWTATFSGSVGSQEAVATITDLDTSGNTIGTPVVVNESGTGGQPQQFQASTGGTITVS